MSYQAKSTLYFEYKADSRLYCLLDNGRTAPLHPFNIICTFHSIAYADVDDIFILENFIELVCG